MLDLIRDIILATDLAHHLRIFKDLQKMADGMFPVAQCAQTSSLLLLYTHNPEQQSFKRLVQSGETKPKFIFLLRLEQADFSRDDIQQ